MAKRGRKPTTGKSAAAPANSARASNQSDGLPMGDYRHAATRKNNPPAKIAAEGTVPAIPKATYAYNPHLPPVLRFAADGRPDALPELLAKARTDPLTDEEARTLADALRIQEPWLEWTGKREKKWFEVDPVALHIHERISTQAILKVAARQDVQRDLFADPQQDYHEAVQFYRHDVDWANRLILGDSLQVMSSLARREDLAGKVQMIYMDPPYGIKFASNFQPQVGQRDVKDKEQDLTREPEMVRAYRDTWHLGIHSYLSYLRDRLIVARELLADTGSIFVQISDENAHRVRQVLDEVFGTCNFISEISFKKTTTATAALLPPTNDYLLWYGRNKDGVKYKAVFSERRLGGYGAEGYSSVLLPTGFRRQLQEMDTFESVAAEGGKVCAFQLLQSQRLGRPSGPGSAMYYEVNAEGRVFVPSGQRGWTTTREGMKRLVSAERALPQGANLAYLRSINDFPVMPLNTLWTDTQSGSAMDRRYVVQTNDKVIARCMLMTTEPGDLVLDPTCGSGTTAYVAEQWGRRWITIDTSRVAVAIARQRVLTAKFDMYRIKPSPQPSPDGRGGPADGFIYKTVPHITLKSIAQNVALDPIFAKHEPILDKALAACNAALAKVKDDLREKLCAKLATKAAKDGTRTVTDADSRRWILPGTQPKTLRDALESAFAAARKKLTPAQRKAFEEFIPQRAQVGPSNVPENGVGWEHWQVPFDTDDDWPGALREAVTAYRTAWRAKMDEVNACIAASAEQEELVDQPEIIRGVTRVSGPFTVEAVQPPELTLGDNIDPQTSVRADAGAASPLTKGGQRGVTTPDPSSARRGADDGMFEGAPEKLPDGFEPRSLRMVEPKADLEVANVTAYLEQMYRFLKADGVRFLNNKQMKFTRLEPLFESGRGGIFHAEGRWVPVGDEDADSDGPSDVGVIFGPQYGPFTAKMIEEVIKPAGRKYDHLVIAAFNFTGEATAILSENPHPKLKIHFAHIRPDINPGMNGLLKESPQPGSGQLFSVFGLPRVRVEKCATAVSAVAKNQHRSQSVDTPDEYTVTMEGVDIYNPVDNSITSSGASKVAAWFLDSDYDGRTFCVTQAFFPDRSAWDKLSRALNGKDGPIDAERFEAFSGTTSLPFPAGENGCIAVKVIDPRGNEVMSIQRL